ncbi:MAG: T9SS type A sorting domain-containing protein [Candidatus Azobacteroides sp.]|nr:T9SS type A sorting domain-containing protein [Candidatus Azobacteroides sp.]
MYQKFTKTGITVQWWRPFKNNVANPKSLISKRNFLICGMLLIAFCAFTNEAMGQTYSGGSGTAADPYLISSNADMTALANAVNGGNNYSGKYFLLTQDITAGVTTIIGENYYGGGDWIFSAVFDGGYHSINMNITNAEYSGIFAYLSGATVKNLNVKGNISSYFYSGGICGYATNTTITNCSNSGVISSDGGSYSTYSGGICGYASGSIITNCSNTGSISSSISSSNSTTSTSGGICGYAASATIKNCSNTGSISSSYDANYNGHSYSGGICGYVATNISITNCSNAGDISSFSYTDYYYYYSDPVSVSYAGGIYGYADNSSSNITVTSCLNTGDISSSASSPSSNYATSTSGGICGYCVGRISQCFDANTRITANGDNGSWSARIAPGTNGTNGTVERCYALSSVLVNGAIVNSADVTDRNGANGDVNSFQSQSWITNNLQWDFANVWYMPSTPGYPLLKKLPNIRVSNTSITYGSTATIISDNTNSVINYSISDNSIVSMQGNTIIPLKAGSVTITATQAGGNEFTSDTESFTIIIQKKQVMVTANNLSISYGDTPAFTCQYSGFVNGETEAVLTSLPVYDCNATSTSYVGNYTIVPSSATAQNYSFVYQNGMLTIGKRALNVTPNNATRIYGTSNPTFSLTYNGFVNNENASVIITSPIAVTTANNTSSAGDYLITCSGGNANNYSFNYGTGTLTVTQAPLTITAQDASRPQGQPNPVFTLIYNGFKNSENESVLDILPVISCMANISSPAGFYDIVLSGGSDHNYQYTLVNGLLGVTAAGGINDVVANQLSIFPNPAKDEIFIKSELPITKVEIYTLTGRLLLSENNFNEKISVSALPQGVYMVKIYTNEGLAVSKIVKE